MNFNLIADRKEACIDYNDELDDEEGKAKNDDFEEDDEPDFMDNSGKCWEFGSKIVDEKHLKEWCQNKMGGMIVGKEEKLTRQFHCQIKQCQFKAIFLKSFSIVYTRNKHNHGIENGKNNQRKKEEKISSLGRDYVDHFGKTWTFHAQIEKNIPHDKLLAKFGFTRIHNIRKTTLNLRCTISNQTGGMCPFSGIYLKSNGFLYIRGEHEHTKRMKIPQNIGDDYVDREGKIWKFNSEIGKNIKRKIFLTKFGFNNTLKKGSRFNMNCLKKGPNGTSKFAGIYLISNGCLYTRGKHSVHIEKNTKPNVGDDYVDHLGQLWPFHSKIDKKDISKEIFRNKFGFATFQRKERGFNLYCKKEMTNGGKCQFSGIYLNSNECLYIRGKHQHKSD